ncbi:hypothetical protein GQ53DRAFT_226093 [Thozetella sp. PMI_491]|nr:hypothetical protein GQ53DRAFT_226093 [Thozetella sp. PMI_491]
MYKHMLTALLGLTSLAAAVPTSFERDATPSEKGLKHKSRAQKRAPLIIQENIIVEPQITVVEQNLDALSALANIAEKEFAALVQSQIALVTQLETIKNNIRVNHFKARFSQVNTVIVTVTNVIDSRDSKQSNKRYLLNQLVADNGFPDKLNLVMVSDKQEMTIGASPTLDLSGLQVGSASVISTPTATPGIQNFNNQAPFGAFNGSFLLPFNTSSPQLPAGALVLQDPADIIFAGSTNLFVQDNNAFASDCTNFIAQSSSFLNLASALLYPSIDAAIIAQLGALQIGGGLPIIPAAVLLNNPLLAGQAQPAQAVTPQVVGGSAAPAAAPEAAAAGPGVVTVPVPAAATAPAVAAAPVAAAPVAEGAAAEVAPSPAADPAPATTERVIPTFTPIAG